MRESGNLPGASPTRKRETYRRRAYAKAGTCRAPAYAGTPSRVRDTLAAL